MKFCARKTHEYVGLNGIPTSTHYITIEDVFSFHGEEFLDKWQEFIKNKPSILVNDKKCYFYADYEIAARKTNSFLHPEN